MTLNDMLCNEILPIVRKPSRYLGTELNAAHKDLDRVELRIALVFPDLYELGLGNLGLHILYAILNDLPWCWAERAYAPAADMEATLRARGLPLFAQESRDPLSAMDLIGFTLQSELTYTNVLNVIDLAGIPLRSQDRSDTHPLVFAGGPAAVNPEPMAPFMDFFVIGDGEEVVVELAELARGTRRASRHEKLAELATLDGVYVPQTYPFETLANGRIVPEEGAPRIVRRLVKDLDAAPYPTRGIVPFTHLVHDRVGLEVFRGCTHGCRFCQAGMTNRPVRERSLATLEGLMRETLAYTGHDEVSLVSLSTCDYTRVRALLEQSAKCANASNTAVSLPSLWVDTLSVELADLITGVRRSGLTFAPEASTTRLRMVINKCIPDEDLLDASAEAFRRGWGHVKCYFMIGLPTETDEDVEAIAHLCMRVLERGKAITKRAKVFTTVSTFVPKPFTPFQWAEQIGLEETRRRQRILKKRFRGNPGIKYGRHKPESTFIEGLIARGDRRTADLIETAFHRGARFETDDACLNLQVWQDAIDETGYDVSATFHARALDERLSWDHIDVLIPKAWLQAEWARAMAGKPLEDCRRGQCNRCGVHEREAAVCAAMLERVRQAELQISVPQTSGEPERTEPPPAQRLRFRIGRRDEARFLSHLEWANAWIRALRRAQAPLCYSQGFRAHPKVAFAAAPPVGEESQGDYMDIVLKKRMDPHDLLDRLQTTLPQGFLAFEAVEVPLKAPSLMSAVTGFAYRLEAVADPNQVEAHVRELLGAETLIAKRTGRPTGRRKRNEAVTVDLRPTIRKLAVTQIDGNRITLDLTTTKAGDKLAKPREIIALLGLDPITTRVVKHATYLENLAG